MSTDGGGGGIHLTNTEGDHFFDGAFLYYDAVHLGEDIGRGDWQAAAFMGGAAVIDGAATWSDPFGSLLSIGFGWLIDHIEPLRGWLDDLTGNPESVSGHSAEWRAVSQALASAYSDLTADVSADLGDMHGQMVTAYRGYMRTASAQTDALSRSAASIANGLELASSMVDLVRSMVRDAIAQICGALTSYIGELVFTLGAATPLVIEQAETRTASVAAHLATTLDRAHVSLTALQRLINELKDALRKFETYVEKSHYKPRHGSPPAPRHAKTLDEVTTERWERLHEHAVEHAKDVAKGQRDNLGAESGAVGAGMSRTPDEQDEPEHEGAR